MSSPSDHDGAGWTFAPATSEAVRRYLASGAWRADAVLVKENRRRRVFRCHSLDLGLALYVKQDLPGGLFGLLKHQVRCKAAQEFGSFLALQEVGIAVPAPLGWTGSWRGGLLATAELPGRSLRDLLYYGKGEGSRVREPAFLDALARFVNRVLRAGIWHPDLHAGNILVTETEGGPTFALLDLYGAEVRTSLGLAEICRQLILLVPLLERTSPSQRARFLRLAAADLPAIPPTGWWPELERAWALARMGKWGGWKSRLLGDSSMCTRVVDPAGTWLFFGGQASYQAEILAAVALYEVRDDAAVTILKDDRKRRVARLAVGSHRYIVKEYIGRPWQLGWWSPGRQSWLRTNRAYLLCTAVAHCLAWGRGRSGNGYLVLEDVGELCLYDHVSRLCPTPAQRQPWLERAAELLAALHVRGCFHADLKLANWVPSPDGRLRLVDCDDVRFFRHLPEWARERNLRQLAESCPPAVARREKLRFLAFYGRAAEVPATRLRELAQRL